MPHRKLANKLNPARKAWKSFATKVQPKIQKLLKHSIPNAFKATTNRLLISFNSFFFSKFRSISNTSTARNPNFFNTHQKNYYMNNDNNNKNVQPLYHKSFSAIHIDELFDNMHEEKTPGSTSHIRDNHKNKGKKLVDHYYQDDRRVNWRESKSGLYSVEDAWKAVVAASPQLRCVDERADEFIFKVRQDMKLQKEKSELEFQEMLARGA